jgi:hypothetical protein
MKKSKPITSRGGDLPFEDAERQAFAKIKFSEEEVANVATRLVQGLKGVHLQAVQWATVRHLRPHLLWESSFEGDKELRRFRKSFKEYDLQDTPKQMTLSDFLCVMRSKKDVEIDLACFAKHLDYLQENDYSYLLTVQTVHASRDPRQLENPPSFVTLALSAFGKRIKYVLEEYCLVFDMVLTRHEREMRFKGSKLSSPPLNQRQLKTITIPSPIAVSKSMSNSRVVEDSLSAHDGSRSITISYEAPVIVEEAEEEEDKEDNAIDSITSSDSKESSKHALPTEAAAEKLSESSTSRSHSSAFIAVKKEWQTRDKEGRKSRHLSRQGSLSNIVK